ncbi:MAG TPA: MBL fold metallo-hydrolase, partial [Alphaproteobacteria bacterium]|nr:MBL fold metallo-hydrolase [Alphaproteobacteria bacterium]
MAVKTFASQADLADKTVRFDRLADGVYAFTTDGDPNSGVVVGENGVLVMDAQATPAMAQDVLRCIREVTDRPVLYLVLSHYHAVRVLGASAYGAREIIASEATRALVRERGQHDFESEVNRFPRLFRDVESIPGLTVPTLSFESALTLTLGGREVRLLHLGRGHTKGDIVAWLPEERVLLSGDLVE